MTVSAKPVARGRTHGFLGFVGLWNLWRFQRFQGFQRFSITRESPPLPTINDPLYPLLDSVHRPRRCSSILNGSGVYRRRFAGLGSGDTDRDLGCGSTKTTKKELDLLSGMLLAGRGCGSEKTPPIHEANKTGSGKKQISLVGSTKHTPGGQVPIRTTPAYYSRQFH
ncbi:hypothetical protein PGT21_009426 [Puccinia graminis f. sp. tritici]|uniref:Uncharacterized protein n=1 Tax=Puccinia graminis f. sp. tritici TaxID=56615 RepID=A0A5B0QT37_PUCGR|nr:hypothetical protein PGTUg99_026712 [Puccinia graminis f. sp. tritici]KAA1116320.1 hypothetical protein PGT21_009426 [Puccinia graminis f. sp. tritici]